MSLFTNGSWRLCIKVVGVYNEFYVYTIEYQMSCGSVVIWGVSGVEKVNGLSKFLIISDNLSNCYSLPRYQAELVVARASGAMTMFDLMRRVKLGTIKEPSLSQVLDTMNKFDFAHVVRKRVETIAPNEKVFYTLVRR